MAGGAGGGASILDNAAAQRRRALAGPSGFRGILSNLKVFFIALFASIGGLLYGYNQGVFAGILVMHNFHEHFASTLDNSALKGMVTSILELGAWVGALTNSFTADKLGRRGTIAVGAFLACVGVIVQTAAQNVIYLYWGRFITGLGVGSLSVGVPLLNSELAPAEVRGALVTLQQLSIELGIMISFWIDYGTNNLGGTGAGQKEIAWRVPLGLQLVPALILAFGMIPMPESPRWLVGRGRDEEALTVLAKLRGLPVNHELVQLEHLEVRAQFLFEKELEYEKFPQYQDGSARSRMLLTYYSYKSMFFDASILRRVIAGAAIMFFQQWNGINAVMYYAPTIFADLGLTGSTTSLLATGVVGIVMLLATLPTVALLDTIGRKKILISGGILMGLCHTVLAILSAIYENSWPTHRAAGWVAVFFVWAYSVAFGYSWGPVAWVYVAEIFPLGVRAKAVAVAASSNWMSNFIIGEITPTLLSKLRFGAYILFGSLSYLSAVFVWWYCPETKGVSLEAMDVAWGDTSRSAAQDIARLQRINDALGLSTLADGTPQAPKFETEDEKLSKSGSVTYVDKV